MLMCGSLEMPVTGGQWVWLDADADEWDGYAGRRILRIEGPDIQISVIATNAFWKVGTCTAYPPFDDDEYDDDWQFS